MGANSFPVAVIMERILLDNRWAAEKWEAHGVVPDVPGAAGRVIYQDDRRMHILFPGHEISLHRDEAEGYYLNLTSPEPRVFVRWRMDGERALPELLTVSYGEAARWMDADHNVDGVPMPAEILAWVGAYVEENYRPEPKFKRKRT
ncbi:MAG: DUF3305 domain-containing protein [Betaproteobacteria bacterium]|nr:DUF3305 domain-containing protein [Betaproteobacteria bacterium]